MIDTIFIDNYKQFKAFKLENLNRINIISGLNNTGKSSILEALFLFYDRTSPDYLIRQHGLRASFVGENSSNLWRPLFNDFDLSKTITIRITDSGNVYEAKYDHLEDASGQITELQSSGKPLQSVTLSTSEENKLSALKSSFKQGRIPTGVTYVYPSAGGASMSMTHRSLKSANKTLVFVTSSPKAHHLDDANRFSKLVIEGKSEVIAEYAKVLEPRIRRLTIATTGNTPTIYCDVGLSRLVPLNMMGEGLGKYLSILFSVASTKNGIICIDELENGIHYSKFQSVFETIDKLAKENNNQIFITTHDDDLLKGVNQHLLASHSESFGFIRIDYKNGEYKPKYYDGDLINAAIESNWEIR